MSTRTRVADNFARLSADQLVTMAGGIIAGLALGRDIVDEAEFVAGLDQAAEGVLRSLKATHLWQKAFGPVVGPIGSR